MVHVAVFTNPSVSSSEGIQESISYALYDKEHFHEFRIEVTDVIHLESLHVGILTKKNVSKNIYLKEKIKEFKMFSDKSIYNCDEIEASGELDLVLNKIKMMLNTLFEREGKV